MKKLTRREALGAGVTAASTAAIGVSLEVRAAPSTWLRPPGALAEEEFLARCIRCFRCAEVCLPACIQFASLFALLESDTPFVDTATSACTLCMRCGEACPTGALVQIAASPQAISASVKMGEPVLSRDDCLAWNRRQPCHLCFDVCPYQGTAVKLVTDKLAPEFSSVACVGCGLCSEACPVEKKAVRIVRLASGGG